MLAAGVVQGAVLTVPRFFAVEIGDARLAAAGDLLRGGFAEEGVDGWEGGGDEGDAGLDHAEEGDERVVPGDVGGADPEHEGADADAGGDDCDEGDADEGVKAR